MADDGSSDQGRRVYRGTPSVVFLPRLTTAVLLHRGLVFAGLDDFALDVVEVETGLATANQFNDWVAGAIETINYIAEHGAAFEHKAANRELDIQWEAMLEMHGGGSGIRERRAGGICGD